MSIRATLFPVMDDGRSGDALIEQDGKTAVDALALLGQEANNRRGTLYTVEADTGVVGFSVEIAEELAE